MGLKCGIVGLPNVGKSTLYNALTATQAAVVANYPFCTIEPNSGIVAVPDERLNHLAKIVKSKAIIPAYIEFVDIAGLVKGASKGEGLGNKFLSHIREVDAIIHVLRCFKDDNITNVYDSVDPLRDAEIIETELILADLELIERKLSNIDKKYKSGDKSCKEQLEILSNLHELLLSGKPAIQYEISNHYIKQLQLLTTKPILYICNVSEQDIISGNQFTYEVIKKVHSQNSSVIHISSIIEAEISKLNSQEEKNEFLKYLGLKESGLVKVIQSAYKLLNLKSYFTVGVQEARAWTFESGTLAPQAAGIIHSDFQKGFIRAEVISYEDYIKYNGELGAKEKGSMHLQGKDYVVQDGDVIFFRFNV